MRHDDAQLLAAGAVLGDLDAAEWRERGADLACAGCASLESELRGVVADLALLAPRRVPPATLLADIKAAVRASDAEAPVQPGPTRGVPAGQPIVRPSGPVVGIDARPGRRPVYAALALAASLAAVAAGLGAATARLASDLGTAQHSSARLTAQVADDAAVMAALANPAHRTAALRSEALAPGAAAQVVYVPGTTQSWVVATGMPATPAGETYELWYADAAGAHPLSTADWPGGRVMVVPVGVDLARSAAVMITLEPAGGATGAPGPQVVFGQL